MANTSNKYPAIDRFNQIQALENMGFYGYTPEQFQIYNDADERALKSKDAFHKRNIESVGSNNESNRISLEQQRRKDALEKDVRMHQINYANMLAKNKADEKKRLDSLEKDSRSHQVNYAKMLSDVKNKGLSKAKIAVDRENGKAKQSLGN